MFVIAMAALCTAFNPSRNGHHRHQGSIRLQMSIIDNLGDVVASVNDKILMENAERLGRIERELIGKRHPVEVLQPIPLKGGMEKKLKDGNLLTKAILLRDGCVSIRNAISCETADKLLAFVNNEKLSSEKNVIDGKADYDDLFGAVNNRFDFAVRLSCLFFTF